MAFFKKNKFEKLEFPSKIDIGEIGHEIEVNFSPKKSSSVVIRENKIIFRLSSNLSLKQAQEHFSTLLKRVYKSAQKKQNNQNFNSIDNIIEKKQFTFANTIYNLEYTKSRGVKLIENTFYINYKTKPELIDKHIQNHLIKTYTPRMKEYIKQINFSTFKFNFKEISMKNLKSKWGHCTHDNNILLNLRLLNAPTKILDYVIIHELAHIKVKNHSEIFWREVRRFCPEYKQMRKELRLSPPQLYLD